MERIPLEAYRVSYDQLMWTIGTLIGVLFTGGLITAGISCIFFLSTGSHGPKLQSRWLRVYIVILILLVLAFEVVMIVESHESTIFYFYSTERPIQLFLRLRTLHFFLAVVIASLMDGLLVRLSKSTMMWGDVMLSPKRYRLGVVSWSKKRLATTSRSGKTSSGCFLYVYGAHS